MNNCNPPITSLRPKFGRRRWRFGRMRAGSYCPALRAEWLLSACSSSRSLFAGYLISSIFMSWMDYFEHHKRFRAFTCGQVDRRKRSVNDLGFRSVELQFERKLTCNTFPRYSVVLNSNSFVLKICPGKYLATSNFSCYITDDKIFSIAAAAVQSSLYHFPLLDQLLVLTKGKPTSPCLLIARLRAGNVLWFRNSFSEKERHLTRVQHGWMLWWCLRTSCSLIPGWDDVGLHGFHKRWKRSLFPAEKEKKSVI